MDLATNLIQNHPKMNEQLGYGPRVLMRIAEAKASLLYALKKGYDHWIITFSGGKDSTTAVLISLETALKHQEKIRRIDVVYADTMLEIPTIHEYALFFLDYLKAHSRLQKLPVHYNVAKPRIKERFWVCLLGKGYPPPNQRFRWCTRRLKIEPVEDALKQTIRDNQTVIITGVRFGESKDRDRRLIQSCARGGECGQGLWFQHSNRLKAGYLAPLIEWRDCDVWDFLEFLAPSWDYSIEPLQNVYNGRETRFGCWMCSVVRQDRTMQKLTTMSQWSHLRPLLEFRNRVVDISCNYASREIRPDGKPGRLKRFVRKEFFNGLMKAQKLTKMELITHEEIEAIEKLWRNPKYKGY